MAKHYITTHYGVIFSSIVHTNSLSYFWVILEYWCFTYTVLKVKFFIIDSLHERCPNTELFLVRIFLYSDWIWIFTHWVKSVQIRSYFWSVFSCIRTEYRKIRTRNNSVFGNFSRSDFFSKNDQILRRLLLKITFTEEILNEKLYFLCSGT